MLPLIVAHLFHGAGAHQSPLPAAAVHGAVPPSHAAHAVAVPAHTSHLTGDLGTGTMAPALAAHVAHIAIAPAHMQAHTAHAGLVLRSKV